MTDCCKKPSIATLHEHMHTLVEGRYVQVPFINRLCTNCYTHWYGSPDNLIQYTKAEWDKKINQAFDEEVLNA